MTHLGKLGLLTVVSGVLWMVGTPVLGLLIGRSWVFSVVVSAGWLFFAACCVAYLYYFAIGRKKNDRDQPNGTS
jgi:membrane protein DedA with SNARE-associated domain